MGNAVEKRTFLIPSGLELQSLGQPANGTPGTRCNIRIAPLSAASTICIYRLGTLLKVVVTMLLRTRKQNSSV
jgi:hypothetical protein